MNLTEAILTRWRTYGAGIMSQRTLARRAGMTPLTVYRILAGRQKPSSENLSAIARELGLSGLRWRKRRTYKPRIKQGNTHEEAAPMEEGRS